MAQGKPQPGDALGVLRERGFIHQISDESGLAAAMERPVTAYQGFDPSSESLQIGNLVGIMLLAHLQRCGHRPIVITGGGTGMVGDPSFRTTQRAIMTLDEIQHNLEGQKVQFGRYLDFGSDRALMLNNADWLVPLHYVEFLRDIGRHFSVNQLLQHETYRERLAGEGLSFIELNYALLQAYDFLHLYREYDCRLQIGGSDQWFNILAGVDLIRRVEGGEAFALVTPLITIASGEKMGKTAGGAVWLDPRRTSPYEYYQFWINTEDPDVERFLALFTFLPLQEVRELGRLEGAELNHAKEVLAFEATRLTHGEAAAAEAQATSRALFTGDGQADGAPTTEISAHQLQAGLDLADMLVETGLAGSKRAARDLIRQGGAYVNGARVDQTNATLGPDHASSGQILLRAGRKRFHRLLVQD